MTLEQLRIFLAVAERQHMTRAAEALNLTQPAVSSAIAALEARHDLPLFHRIGRHIELTEAGMLLCGEARAILRRVQDAEASLADLRGLRRGRLRLAASQTVGNYWLPPLMARFRRAFIHIDLDLTIGNTEQVALAVKEGVAELGIVEAPIHDDIFEQTLLPGDRLLLVAAATDAGLRLSRQLTPLAAADENLLAGADWVWRESGSGTRQLMEEMLTKLGLDPGRLPRSLELPSNEAVRLAVEAGAGFTIISNLAVASSLQEGRLLAWDLTAADRQFRLLRHHSYQPSQAVTAFQTMLTAAIPAMS
jgi:DNA-binding transcriptional LysR family regulator